MNPCHSIRRVLLLALLTPLAVSGEVIGFTAEDNLDAAEATELFLSRPGESIPRGESWIYPDLFPFKALELDVDGTLLALHTLAISADRISRLDLETGTVTPVTGSSVGQRELALDPAGVLWTVNFAGELRAYDFATQQLGPRLMMTYEGADRVGGLAWRDGQLYALFNGEQSDDGPVLGVVDTTTGAVGDLRELVPLRPDPFMEREVTALDFDDRGGLWVGFVDILAAPDPPLPRPAVAFLPSPAAPEAEIRPIGGDPRSRVPLAVAGSPSVTDIPTLSHFAATLLALLLLAAALPRLRRV